MKPLPLLNTTPTNQEEERQEHALLQPLLGAEATTTVTFNETTNELDMVHHVSSFFCTEQQQQLVLENDNFNCRTMSSSSSSNEHDEEQQRCQKIKYKHQDQDKELCQKNRISSSSDAAACGTSWASSSSCCFGCYHATVTVSWLLLSLLLTSQWTVFVYYPRVHGNNNHMRAPEEMSSTVTSTTMLFILSSMNEKDLRVVALAFCLYLLTLGILGWVGISLYHRHLLYRKQQQQQQQRHVMTANTTRNVMQQQQRQQQQHHHVDLRRLATSILVVLNIALLLLLMDKRGLALVAMIACLVALLWSFAMVYCLDNVSSEEEEDKHDHQRLVACIIV